jgi:beta-galactosidase
VEIDASAPPEMLARRRGLIVPTFDFLDADLAARLAGWAHAGGALLTGPRRPSRDEAMAPLSIDLPGALLPSRGLDEPALVDGAIAELAQAARARRPARSSDPFVEVCVHRRADGAPALVFLGNASGEARRAEVTVDGAAGAEDALDGEQLAGESWSVTLAPYSWRTLLVS